MPKSKAARDEKNARKLGTGMARGAANNISNRNRRMEEELGFDPPARNSRNSGKKK